MKCKLWYIPLVVFILLLSYHVRADTVAYIHTVSYHQDREPNYNELNYGAGIRHYVDVEKFMFSYATVGSYKNSLNRNSKYAGVGWEWKVGKIDMGLVAGLITGYDLASTLPFIFPTIAYKKARIVIVAYPTPVIHLTLDVWRF